MRNLITSSSPNCAPTAFYNAAIHRGDDADLAALTSRLKVTENGADMVEVEKLAAELGYQRCDSIMAAFDSGALCAIVNDGDHMFLIAAYVDDRCFCIDCPGSWQNDHLAIDDANETYLVPGSRFTWRPINLIKAQNVWAVPN